VRSSRRARALHVARFVCRCCEPRKGRYAKPLDSGQIVNAIAAFNAGLRVNVFWEYVRSKANVAGFPSRLRLDLVRAALRNAGIEIDPVMVKCALPSVL
jgi:hypothetical protein